MFLFNTNMFCYQIIKVYEQFDQFYFNELNNQDNFKCVMETRQPMFS